MQQLQEQQLHGPVGDLCGSLELGWRGSCETGGKADSLVPHASDREALQVAVYLHHSGPTESRTTQVFKQTIELLPCLAFGDGNAAVI